MGKWISWGTRGVSWHLKYCYKTRASVDVRKIRHDSSGTARQQIHGEVEVHVVSGLFKDVRRNRGEYEGALREGIGRPLFHGMGVGGAG